MKSFLFLALLISSRAPAQTLSAEVLAVKARLAAEGYPMPEATIEQLDQIEAELTPSQTELRSEVIEQTAGKVCDQQTIRIFYRLSDDSPAESFLATFYQPHIRLLARLPGVVIEPTLAGPSGLEKAIASQLCFNQMASVVPNETILALPAQLPDFKAYDRNMRVEMIRARRLVDFLSTHANVEANQIGVIGFSRGAIAGALLVGIEPRLHFAFLGAGGVGLGHIIPNSQTDKGKIDNAAQMQASGLTLPQFEQKLIETIRYDPILFSQRFPTRNLKIMIVKDDNLVDVKNQQMLRRSFGNPTTIVRQAGHVGSIVGLVFTEWGLPYLEFFQWITRAAKAN